MSERYKAEPCPCGYRTCRKFQIRQLAAEAKFDDEFIAQAVADLLNDYDAMTPGQKDGFAARQHHENFKRAE